MLQACRIITVWAARRASQQRMKLACVLTRKRALRRSLPTVPLGPDTWRMIAVPELDLNLITKNIEQTGFPLQHEVAELLRLHGWSVISSKYYLDDVQNVPREIDLIAYKVKAFQKVQLYTTLVISCKKSEKNAWVCMLQKPDFADPNINWHPQTVWTNQRCLRHMLEKTDWIRPYVSAVSGTPLFEDILNPTGHAFAFQEVDKKSSKAQNDKNIFNSITSLMKAEGYELSSLAHRKKEKALYCFHLISILDSDLVTVTFKESERVIEKSKDGRFIVNYIVNGRERSSRIHFITYPYLSTILDRYDELAAYNTDYFNRLHDSFYEDIFSDYDRVELLKEDFKRRLLWEWNYEYSQAHGGKGPCSDCNFFFDKKEEVLRIGAGANEAHTDFLNRHEGIRKHTQARLKEVYRYTGDFKFVEEVPF